MFINQNHSIKILSVLKMNWEPTDCKIPPRPFDAVSFRNEGDCRLSCGQKKAHLKTGDVLFLPKNRPYEIHTKREQITVVHFDIVGCVLPDFETYRPKNKEWVGLTFEKLYRTWNCKKTGYYNQSMMLFYSVLSGLEQEESPENQFGFSKIEPALHYLSDHLDDPDLNVADLCAACHYSDVYFRKLFSRYMGKNPKEYLLSRRIELAKELLKYDVFSVDAISGKCGFRDAKHFSTIFKARTGFSPREFRAKEIP